MPAPQKIKSAPLCLSIHEVFNLLAATISEKGIIPNQQNSPTLGSRGNRIEFKDLEKALNEKKVTGLESFETLIQINNVESFLIATKLVRFQKGKDRIRMVPANPLPAFP